MKAFVAIDSFKGCLSTFQANDAAALGLRQCGLTPEDISLFPVSDGGEGFCDVVSCYLEGYVRVRKSVHGPAGDFVDASYLICGQTAYIESASACGYTLVKQEDRSPLKTSSFGLGELIADALAQGATKIVIGMGGTSTCDGGAGMLQALGVRFCSDAGLLADGAPAMLVPLTGMDTGALDLRNCSFEAWSDTRALFWGESGAVKVFGAQKGVTPEMSDDADAWMKSLAALYGPCDVEGSGAAGGIGGALHAVLGAEIVSGAESILKLAHLKERLMECTDEPAIVLTGEGRLDAQTLTGKLPAIVAELADEARESVYDLKVVCLAGRAEWPGTGHPDASVKPFDAVAQITPDGTTLEEALKTDVAAGNLSFTVKEIFSYEDNIIG